MFNEIINAKSVNDLRDQIDELTVRGGLIFAEHDDLDTVISDGETMKTERTGQMEWDEQP